MTEFVEAGASLRSARLRLSAALWRRPWLKLALLLAAPVLVFAVVYLGALVSLFVSLLWKENDGRFRAIKGLRVETF